MKIKQVIGREIFDSRGFPTIECELILEENKDQLLSVKASVPSGASTGKYEAKELRDDEKRLTGKGVLKAIENLENKIAPLIIGKEPDIISMDMQTIELDGTKNKSCLGSNATLASSLAILRAQAMSQGMETYELIASLCGLESISIPIPMFNIINGGVHATNKIDFQEFMIIPIGQSNFRSAMENSAEVFYTLSSILKKKGLKKCMGDEGGFAPDLKSERETLDLIMEAIEKSNCVNDSFAIAIDVASSRLYNSKKNEYTIQNQTYSPEKLINFYGELINDYPIIYIEDGFAEDDWNTWKTFTKKFGEQVQIVGDDLFATNPSKILKGAEEKAANATIIKPNQIGTITETILAIITAREQNLNTIISHRSGETNDNLIVDLAIGTQSGLIKAGGLTGGERLSKYNRILRIEDKLTMQAMNS